MADQEGYRAEAGATVERRSGSHPAARDIEARLRSEGLDPARWSSPPASRFPWHEHDFDKVLYCAAGGIVFHLAGGQELALEPGDRMDLEAGTSHAATAGAAGVTCVEAARLAPPG